MKRVITLCLCFALLATMAGIFGGCGDSAEATLKFGAGVYVSEATATDATVDKDGSGKVDVTVAAVTLNADGKIAACALDTMSNTVAFTKDGKAVANAEFKTKYELGDNYNMVAYGQATAEWYKQADAFEAFVVGKTIDEVKALVAEGNKGNADVIAAGCTIMIHEFVGAIEKACAAAADSAATASNTLKVTIATEQTCSDATIDKAGSNKVAVYTFAAAIDANGKVVVAASDCAEVDFTFTTAGKSTLANNTVVTKKEKGDNYGMVAYGNAAKEWYAQAAAFDAACVGKTGAEIAGLQAADGKGVADLQAAGCTIYITGFVKAAAKIG